MVQKRLNERQTVQTLIIRHILWRLIRVCTVYQGLSYRIFRVNTVIKYIICEIWRTNNCWMNCKQYTPWSDERSIWSGSTLFAHKIQIKICLSYRIFRQSRHKGYLLKLYKTHEVVPMTISLCVCLFVLRFYGPVNPVVSCRARSVYLYTRLLVRLSPLSG